MATTEEAKLRVLLEMKDKLSPGFKKAGEASNKFDKKLQEMRGTLLAVGVAATAAVGLSVKEFVAFDKGMREVNTLLDINETQFQTMSDQVRELSTEMGINGVAATKSLYQAISSGIPAENSLDFMRTAARLSIGGVTDLETATLGLKTAMNAYSVDVKDSEKISDILFETMRLGTTTIGELSSFMFQAVPTAAAFGVSLEEVAAATALVTRQGSPTSFVMRGLRAAMVALVKPTEDMQELIEKMGFKSGGAALEAMGLQKTLESLLQAAGGSKDMLTAAGLQAESLAVVFGITGEKAEEFDEFLRDISDSAGATSAAVDKMEDSAARSFERMNEDINETKRVLGEALLPTVLDVTNAIAGMAQAFSGAPSAVQGMITGATLGIGGLAVLGTVWPKIVAGAKTAAAGIKGLVAAATFAGSGTVAALAAIPAALGVVVLSSNSTINSLKGVASRTEVAYKPALDAMQNFERSMNRVRMVDGMIDKVNELTGIFGDFHIAVVEGADAMHPILSDSILDVKHAIDETMDTFMGSGKAMLADYSDFAGQWTRMTTEQWQWNVQAFENGFLKIEDVTDVRLKNFLQSIGDSYGEVADTVQEANNNSITRDVDFWDKKNEITRLGAENQVRLTEEAIRDQIEAQKLLDGQINEIQSSMRNLGLSYEDINEVMGITNIEFIEGKDALGLLEDAFRDAGVEGGVLEAVMLRLKTKVGDLNEEVAELFDMVAPIEAFDPNSGLGLTGIDIANRQGIKEMKDAIFAAENQLAQAKAAKAADKLDGDSFVHPQHDKDIATAESNLEFAKAALESWLSRLPAMASGGIVGGALNSPQPIIAHGGETVLPVGATIGGGGGVTINMPGVTGIILDTQIDSLVNEALSTISGGAQDSFQVGAANVSWAG